MENTHSRLYTIVGLRHHDWQGDRLAGALASATGRRVLLMHDETNDWNGEATAAYIDTEMVGYVANSQCREASAYCDASPARLLEGVVTAADAANRRLTVRVSVGDGVPATADDTLPYEHWEHHYHTVPLMSYTPQERRLLLLRRDLLMRLADGDAADAATASPDLLHCLQVYRQLMGCDVSREATDDRRRIIHLLLASPCPSLRREGEQLDIADTSLGSPEARASLADYLFCQLPATDEFRQMAARHADIATDALEQQLRLFPHRLFDEYRLSKTDFASKLYYRRVPQRALRYFLSGLLLVDHLRSRPADTSRQREQAVGDALSYVGRISGYASEAWTAHIDTLWQQLADTYCLRISETHRAKNTTFNRRFVCQVVGTLLALCIYRKDVTQMQYTRLLEGDSRSSLRKDINQGIADEDIRQTIRRMLRGED